LLVGVAAALHFTPVSDQKQPNIPDFYLSIFETHYILLIKVLMHYIGLVACWLVTGLLHLMAILPRVRFFHASYQRLVSNIHVRLDPICCLTVKKICLFDIPVVYQSFGGIEFCFQVVYFLMKSLMFVSLLAHARSSCLFGLYLEFYYVIEFATVMRNYLINLYIDQY
jgi:hypothetical protein